MNHAGDDVFAGAAFTLNEYRDVGAGELVQALAEGTHCLGVSEDDGVGGDLA